MNTIIYVLIFLIGIICGNIYTKIIKKSQTKNKKSNLSVCSKCNKEYSLMEKIPIIGFILSRGRCKNCGTKKSILEPMIELLAGICFLGTTLGVGINSNNIFTYKILELILGILFISFLFIIAGVDFKTNKIHKPTLIYGLIISLLNIIYHYFTAVNFNLNRIIIYLIVIAILTVLSTFRLRKKAKNDYEYSIVILCIIINFFTFEIGTILSIIFALLIIAIKTILNHKSNKNNKNSKKQKEKLPIAGYICIANVFIWLSIFLLQLV